LTSLTENHKSHKYNEDIHCWHTVQYATSSNRQHDLCTTPQHQTTSRQRKVK